MYRVAIDNIECNYSERYIGIACPNTVVRLPFYSINEITVFQNRISIFYKKSSVATYRADEDDILSKAHELKKTKLKIRNSNQGGS